MQEVKDAPFSPDTLTLAVSESKPRSEQASGGVAAVVLAGNKCAFELSPRESFRTNPLAGNVP